MGFVDDDHDAFALLGLFGSERVSGLGDQRSLVKPPDTAEGGDDAVVDAAGANGGVVEVDDGVAGGVIRRGVKWRLLLVMVLRQQHGGYSRTLRME